MVFFWFIDRWWVITTRFLLWDSILIWISMFFLYLKLQQQQKSLNMLHNLLNLNYLPLLFCPKFLYVNICFVKCFERMYFHMFCLQVNHFNDIMALVLTAIVVYCEFNPKSGKSIEYKIDICYLSAKCTSS